MANGPTFPFINAPDVNIAGGIQGLVTQYKAQQRDELKRSTLQSIMSGQQQDPTAAIMGYVSATGDLQGGSDLANVFKAARGPQLTPDAILAHQDKVRDFDIEAAQRRFDSNVRATPKERLDFWQTPEGSQYAPDWFKQGPTGGSAVQPMRLAPPDAAGYGPQAPSSPGVSLAEQTAVPSKAKFQEVPTTQSPYGQGATTSPVGPQVGQTAAAAAPQSAVPLPAKEEDRVPGTTYQTPKGPHTYVGPGKWSTPTQQAPAAAAPKQQKPMTEEEALDQYKRKQALDKGEAVQLAKRPTKEDAAAHRDSLNSALDDADRTVNELLSTGPEMKLATGVYAWLPAIPGVTSKFVNNLDVLKSQIGLNRFNELRETSKTGSSGFNRLTNFELQTLQNSIASLARSNTDEEMRANLMAVKQRLFYTRMRLQHQYSSEYGSE